MRLYLDACVLLAAWRSELGVDASLIARLVHAGHTLLSSRLLELEVSLIARHYRRNDEARFYDLYLSLAEDIPVTPAIVHSAVVEGAACGLGAMDALHLAAAFHGSADRFVTLERRTKPMYRSSLVTVVHADDL